MYLWTPTRLPAPRHFACDGGDLVSSIHFYKSTKSAPNVPLQTCLAFLTIPSSKNLIYPRKALRTMLGYRRTSDHKRTRLPECWRVGMTAVFSLVSCRLCLTCSFIPSSLPRPLNSLSPCMHSIFSLADCPHPSYRPWFYKTNASPTSMIVPSFLQTFHKFMSTCIFL